MFDLYTILLVILMKQDGTCIDHKIVELSGSDI